MADISIINKDNTDYNVKDAAGRLALAEVENKGAKNILKTYDIPETTTGNVVFSIIDGVCSVSTTATQTTAKVLVYAMDTDVGTTTVNSRYTIPRGTYILKTTGNGKVKLRAIEHDGTNVNQLAETTGADVEFTYSGTMPYVVFTLSVSSNTSLSEAVTFIPMCCLKAEYIIDQTAVKYGKTNAELTAENTSQQSEIDYVVNTGAKNKFDIVAAPTINHVTYTLTGTKLSATSNGSWAYYSVPLHLKSGKYKLTMTISDFSRYSGAGEGSIRIVIASSSDGSGSDAILTTITGNGAMSIDFNWSGNCYIIFYVNRSSNAAFVNSFSADNVMVADAAITDPTYEPYALPNPTLTPAAIKAVDEGAKNISNWSASTSTIEHVTFTINSDKTVSTSGTATARSQKPLFFTVPSTLKAGRYVLSGCPSGGAQSGTILYCLYLWDGTAKARVASGNDTGNGLEFDWIPDASHTYNISVDVRSGTNASGLIFKPMICTAADWAVSQKFVPYSLPNPTLTPAVIKAVDEGAKNLFPNYATSQNVGGVTFTVNSDGSITANGTKTNNDWLMLSTENTLKAGTYVLSDGIPIDTTDCQLIITTGTSLGTAIMATAANARPKTTTLSTDYTGLYYAIRIASGKTVNNLNFKPMLCTASDWAVSQKFVPYCPTNRELYETCETKVTMQQAYGDAILIPANSDLNNYTTPGLYYALVANVPTIINTPYNATGLRLVVEKNTPSGAAVFQTIYPTSRTHLEFYRRIYEGGSWSSWYKFEGTVVT